jgi:hypothetical protein
MALLAAWTAPVPYATRIENITSDAFAARLESGETVFDDGVPDAVFGGGWQDWFVLTGSMPVYLPEFVEPDHAHQHHQPSNVVDELPAIEGFDLIDSLDKLNDRQTSESIHSLVPHADNPTLQREHLSLFELVRYDEVTHFAVRSGDWSNPSTWLKNKLPGNGARVLIPMDVEVNVDGLFTAKIETIRVDGTLNFDSTRNTELRVDTVVVSGAGTFQMGTAENPIAPHVRARLLFTNTGAIDRKWDPFAISRGLISHGNVSVHGAEVSSIAALAGPVAAGTQALVLASAPVGWKAGDSIAIASTVGAAQNDVRQILAIDGNTLLVDQPLSFAHEAPAENLEVHVAHLTRNAVFESESPITARRGHVMFMHDRDVEIEYAGFYKLGRTDKLQVVNDSVVNSDWKLQSGTGTNQRARYPVHFHRNGLTKDGNPSVVKGSAVVDSPGWGFVNHSSYVDMIENVAYDVRGAAFATEVGDEIGGFYGNMALGTTGSGEADNSRETPFQDFGHQGDGFWFQGAGVSVVGNISAGNQGHAFAYYTRGLIEPHGRGRFLSVNLDDPSIANGEPTIDVGQVPVTNFRDNIGYSSFMGLLIRYHLQESPHAQRSRFENSTFWNNQVGVGLHYTQNLILRDLEVIRIPDGQHTYGIESDIQEANVLYDNVTVIGYHTGIEMPRWGQNEVRGGTFNNTYHDILIPTALWRDRSVLVTGLTGTPRVTLLDDVRQIPDNNNFLFFEDDQVILDFGPLESQRVYYWRQQANIVPFPEARPDIPPQYVGLTNQQLWDQFGKALSGAIAPTPFYTLPYISGALIPQ